MPLSASRRRLSVRTVTPVRTPCETVFQRRSVLSRPVSRFSTVSAWIVGPAYPPLISRGSASPSGPCMRLFVIPAMSRRHRRIRRRGRHRAPRVSGSVRAGHHDPGARPVATADVSPGVRRAGVGTASTSPSDTPRTSPRPAVTVRSPADRSCLRSAYSHNRLCLPVLTKLGMKPPASR